MSGCPGSSVPSMWPFPCPIPTGAQVQQNTAKYTSELSLGGGSGVSSFEISEEVAQKFATFLTDNWDTDKGVLSHPLLHSKPLGYYPRVTTLGLLPSCYYPRVTTLGLLPSGYYPQVTTLGLLPSGYYPRVEYYPRVK